MRQINSTLIKFSEVEIDSINEVITKIETEIKDYDSHSSTYKSDLNTYYNSHNKGDLIAKMDTVGELSKEISEGIGTFFSSIISKSTELQQEIAKLKTKVNSISSLDGKTDTESVTARNQLESEFDRDHDKALKLLNELKQMEYSFKKTEAVQKPISLPTPTGGTFTKQNFKASNGMTFDYYIYIPEGIDPNQPLPLHMYMHGYGERGDKVLNHSLPKMLAEGYKPSGIVVCPQMPADKYGSFQNAYMLPALAEFTQKMMNSYNVDKRRVSLSGHSDGAIGGYKLMQLYPNIFSAFVPISGNTNKILNEEELKRVKIFSFFGDQDNGFNNEGIYRRSLTLIPRFGGFQRVFRNYGHHIQNMVFNQEHVYADGKKYNPLDWAFQQVKA